jgi:glutamate 5-kinase
MVIANSKYVDVIQRIIEGETIGTLFLAHKSTDFNFNDFIS